MEAEFKEQGIKSNPKLHIYRPNSPIVQAVSIVWNVPGKKWLTSDKICLTRLDLMDIALDFAQVGKGAFEFIGQVFEPEHGFDACDQFPFIDGFTEEVVGTGLNGAFDVAHFV